MIKIRTAASLLLALSVSTLAVSTAAVAQTAVAPASGRSAPKAVPIGQTVPDAQDVPYPGGVIALDPKGNVAMPFNTPGMYRARLDSSGRGGCAKRRCKTKPAARWMGHWPPFAALPDG